MPPMGKTSEVEKSDSQIFDTMLVNFTGNLNMLFES